MKELTSKQRALWDLKEAGRSRAEMAVALGVSKSVVNKTIAICRKKLGLSVSGPAKAIENHEPERAAAVLDAMTDPRYEALTQACEAAGLSKRVSSGLVNRLRQKYYGVLTEAKTLQKRDLDDLLGKKIHLMLHYIDDSNAAQAGVRDLAMGAAQLIEKQQLIRGEPTAIISDHERAKLHELAPALLREIKRRGLTIEGHIVEKVIEPARS